MYVLKKTKILLAATIISLNLSACGSPDTVESSSAENTVQTPATEESNSEFAGIPNITRPDSSGKFNRPFASYLGDISQIGYTEEEYFLEGNAACFTSQSELMPDGKWQMTKGTEQPYKTRILVRKPEKPEDFNGTVLVEWLNVSFGYDDAINYCSSVYDDGFAVVCVSAQATGLYGLDGLSTGLIEWDPERYGTLSIPDEYMAYDIFSQAGRAVGPNRSVNGIDPLEGLDVKRVIGIGYSQSGTWLQSYVNGVQPLEHVYDGMMLLVSGGGENPFQETDAMMFGQVREDSSIPVFLINSENESVIYQNFRQEDSTTFRSWEVAGTGHVSKSGTELSRYKAIRDGVISPVFEVYYTSAGWMTPDWGIALGAALEHMNSWIDDGILPPSFSPIEMNSDGTIVRDEYGNANGGVRLPDLEVPVASFTGTGYGFGGLETSFSADKLQRLYPDHESYVEQVTSAAENAAKQGAIPTSMISFYTEQADNVFVPEYSFEHYLEKASKVLPEAMVSGLAGNSN